jgi:hypothetical protein
VSSGAPAIDKDPLDGVHLIALGAVISVHITMLSVPLKQGSLTVADPPLRVARPAQVAPEDIVKPPIGPHEVIVVGGTGGAAGTCTHPAKATALTIIAENIQRIRFPRSSALRVMEESEQRAAKQLVARRRILQQVDCPFAGLSQRILGALEQPLALHRRPDVDIN